MTEWDVTILLDDETLNARVTAETASDALDEVARGLDEWDFMFARRAEEEPDGQAR